MCEDFRAVLGDHHGVLELGASTAVSGEHGPAVVPHVPAAIAQSDHGLDGESHPRFDHGVVARLVVVRNDQSGMKGGVYAVSGVFLDHAVPEALDVAFDHPTDDVHLPARLDGLDRADQRLMSALSEQPAGLIDLAAEESCAGIAMYAADVGGDVDLDDVAVLQGTSIGDAVADDLVDRRAA